MTNSDNFGALQHLSTSILSTSTLQHSSSSFFILSGIHLKSVSVSIEGFIDSSSFPLKMSATPITNTNSASLIFSTNVEHSTRFSHVFPTKSEYIRTQNFSPSNTDFLFPTKSEYIQTQNFSPSNTDFLFPTKSEYIQTQNFSPSNTDFLFPTKSEYIQIQNFSPSNTDFLFPTKSEYIRTQNLSPSNTDLFPMTSVVVSRVSISIYNNAVSLDTGEEGGHPALIVSVVIILIISILTMIIFIVLFIILSWWKRNHRRTHLVPCSNSASMNGINVQKNMSYMPTIYGDENEITYKQE